MTKEVIHFSTQIIEIIQVGLSHLAKFTCFILQLFPSEAINASTHRLNPALFLSQL